MDTVCPSGFSSPNNVVNLVSDNLWEYLPSFSSTKSNFRQSVHLLKIVLKILLIPSLVAQINPVFDFTIVKPRGRCNHLPLEVSTWFSSKSLFKRFLSLEEMIGRICD